MFMCLGALIVVDCVMWSGVLFVACVCLFAIDRVAVWSVCCVCLLVCVC